jgi:hypothetical protein
MRMVRVMILGSHWICDLLPLDRACYRQFLGQASLPGAGVDSVSNDRSMALNLMDDWCVLRTDTD